MTNMKQVITDNNQADGRRAGAVAAVVALFLVLVGKDFLWEGFSGNDPAYLSVARHIINPDYLAGDPFIGNFDYLRLYGAVVGPFVEWFGHKPTAIIGRVFIYFIFAIIFYHLGKLLNLNFLLTAAAACSPPHPNPRRRISPPALPATASPLS